VALSNKELPLKECLVCAWCKMDKFPLQHTKLKINCTHKEATVKEIPLEMGTPDSCPLVVGEPKFVSKIKAVDDLI